MARGGIRRKEASVSHRRRGCARPMARCEPDACSLQARMAEERCPPPAPRPGARVCMPQCPDPSAELQVTSVLAASCVATAQHVVSALSLRLTALYATFKIDTLPTHGYTLLKYT